MDRKQVGRVLRREAPSFAVAIGVALFLRAFVVEAFVIPSGSMLPTLEIGDRLFVDKAVYGLRVPGSTVKLSAGRMPARGEIAVFIPVDRRGPDLIKRVVAVGGDGVELRAGRLYVNGRPVPRRPLGGQAYEEQLGAERYRVLQGPGSAADFGPFHVPPGHVFVLGDNRDNSHDSRFFGPVPRAHLKGRALVIYWSRGRPAGRYP